MATPNALTIIRNYLITDAPLKLLVSDRISYPSLVEGYAYPALSFAGRPGSPSNPNIPGIVYPSIAFKCWGGVKGYVAARNVYGALYDALQGLQNMGSIVSAEEELAGQDLVDPDIPNLNYVLCYFLFKIKNG